jgi:hypothetical protein
MGMHKTCPVWIDLQQLNCNDFQPQNASEVAHFAEIAADLEK